jgi:hypothetical protein
MNSSQPPRLASALLERLAPVDPALIGDLEEAYRHGWPRTWYWRQAVAVLMKSSVRDVRAHKLAALRAALVGWVVLAVMFIPLGDRTAEALASALWGWKRQVAYQDLVWWPFQISAIFVSYLGFAVSAWAVARVHRTRPGPMLLAYVATVWAALVGSAVTIEMLGPGPIPVWHPLFYIVSVTLPYQWRSGFLLVPIAMLIAGMIGSAKSQHLKHAVPR